jgi:hypothetical protein
MRERRPTPATTNDTLTVTTYRYKNACVYDAQHTMVAIMERSPWTGDWCFGLRTEHVGEYGEPTFRPPFQPTGRRTARAAARAAAQVMGQEEQDDAS